MKQFCKRIAAAGLAVGMALSLSACKDNTAEQVHSLVQGNIDAIYLGKFDPDYLKQVGSTENEAEESYLDGLEVEAEYFANYWGIVDASYGEYYDDLDEGLKDDIVSMYKEIYSHSKYEVQDAVKQEDGGYTVKVLVDPIDVMEKAYEEVTSGDYAPLDALNEKYSTVDFNTISDEDYAAYTTEYGQVFVQLVKDQIANLGYLDQESISIQVDKDSEGYYTINDNDWGRFDEMVISYP